MTIGVMPPTRFIKWVAKQRRFGETGPGDTFERIAKKYGADELSKLLKSLGIDCGCDKRKEDWNRTWPYNAWRQEWDN